ncbi:O-antigen/teichoic acid export membrane protein [Salsuginibacillus halophilus]|uniref:O-antigen/teichoic acid export membrane protein n=1 Tax=Salsuginibacillus halophilus TaxID=517424 RepID=A0A2P8HE91_9BACI|nr:polysaccharide biosynthesis protein [Salsuginibacillus halophilus]PSL44515.1 O-antigen/teichoic acid export membrane protein [Salsuginibacillus halophilus]
MANGSLLRGTLILTLATFISKTLGLIYIFPFTAMVGQQGLALYTYGYLPYTILLSLATMGVPMAVSKFVSKYRALGDYETGYRLFRSGIVVMAVTGFVAAAALFLLAPVMAGWIISNPDELEGNQMSDVVFTIRMVSIALLIIPAMSIVRGFFQGYQSMGPTAVSQVVEQIVRIVFILASAFLVLYLLEGTLGTAVGLAVFGAFIGGLASAAVLWMFWRRRREGILADVRASTVQHNLSYQTMYKELIAYALPLSFVGLAIPLFQFVDLFTFNDLLQAGGYSQGEAETAYGVFAQSAHKLILIPMALATAMSINLIPSITNAYTEGSREHLHHQMTQAFQIVLFLTIPAVVGLSVLALPAFGTLYGFEDLGTGSTILRHYAPVAVLFALFSVSAAMLQGLNEQKYAVAALIIGVVVKLGLNVWWIGLFGPLGAVYATAAGYVAAIAINFWALRKTADYAFGHLVKRSILFVSMAAAMAAAVWVVREGAVEFFGFSGWSDAFLVLVFSVAAGGLLYFVLSYRTGAAGEVLGSRFAFLRRPPRS